MIYKSYQEVKNLLPVSYDKVEMDKTLRELVAKNKRKIVVLDDDPTGTQTVHGVNVYTDWSPETFREGFSETKPLFFVLTNSRAFSREKTKVVHQEIATNILVQKQDFILISRGDSTLRGHYPLETESMNAVFKKNNLTVDGEIIVPFFPEGGRYTIEDVHYVRYGDNLIPAGETEFAKDQTFSYKSSNLKEWVEEKTEGGYKKENVIAISLEDIRSGNVGKISDKLTGCHDFGKVIVNAISYDDLKVFAVAYYHALEKGKRFIFRSAAGLVKILGGIGDQPLLSSKELVDRENLHGGLVIAGSHVQKTTAQLQKLKEDDTIAFIELNQHLAMDKQAFEEETKRVSRLTNENIMAGKTTVVMTRRQRFDLGTENKEDELKLAVEIGNKLTQIVSGLSIQPSFIIAKGGITSSDVAAKGLGIKKAEVAGQILPGVPVWKTGVESKFKNLMLVIFPGNVGEEDALLKAVHTFKGL